MIHKLKPRLLNGSLESFCLAGGTIFGGMYLLVFMERLNLFVFNKITNC